MLRNNCRVWDYVVPCYEAAKIIIASPTFRIEDLKKSDRIKQYKKIKAKMLFEEKVLADLEMLKAACTEINPESIMPSFIPKTQVDVMLAYYSQGCKAKVTEEMQVEDIKNLITQYIKLGNNMLD